MKKQLVAILVCFALTHGGFAQTDNQQITDIDNVVQKIKNNIQDFEKIEKFKDSTGYRYVYMKDKELQIISVLYKDKNIDKKIEWYFSDGQLIYSNKIWTDREADKEVDNESCYLANRHVVLWTKGNNVVDKTSKEFKDFETKIIAYADKLCGEKE